MIEQETMDQLGEILYPLADVSRKVKAQPFLDKIFDLICETKQTSIALDCSPKLIALLGTSSECKNQTEGKLELLVACCKVTCYINFTLTEYNFNLKTL